jgi:DNA-binding response OmpR family regulator
MEEGTDVYLGKPVDMRELVLVIRALMRRIGVEVAGQDAAACVLFSEDGKPRGVS